METVTYLTIRQWVPFAFVAKSILFFQFIPRSIFTFRFGNCPRRSSHRLLFIKSLHWLSSVRWIPLRRTFHKQSEHRREVGSKFSKSITTSTVYYRQLTIGILSLMDNKVKKSHLSKPALFMCFLLRALWKVPIKGSKQRRKKLDPALTESAFIQVPNQRFCNLFNF